MIGLSGLYNRLGPVAVVDAVGEEVGLQRHAAALAVDNAALAHFIQKVAGIELDAGAIGENLHGSAGCAVLQNGAGIGGNDPVVVVTALKVQRFKVRANVPGDGLGGAEVHGRPLHTLERAGGDALGIIGIEVVCTNGQQLLHGQIRLFMTGQIKVAVVGHIKDGVLVADAVIDNVQTAVVIQGIGHLNVRISRETLIAVRTVKAQSDGSFGLSDQCPDPLEIEVRAGVEVVFSLVGNHLVFLTTKAESSALNAVGISADGCAQATAAAVCVAIAVVKAQANIHDAILAGDKEMDQAGTVIGNGGGELTTGYGVQAAFLTRGQNAESFFHENGSFHFFGRKLPNYVKNAWGHYTIIAVAFQSFLHGERDKNQLIPSIGRKRQPR